MIKKASISSKNIIYPVVASVILLILSYFINNSSRPFTGGENDLITRYERLKNHNDTKWTDSIFFINTCYDLELIDHIDEHGIRYGKEAVTNKKDLYTLLKIISKCNYKYIVLDLDLFDYDSEYNDSIKDLVKNMDNICVPYSKNMRKFDAALQNKIGWVDYRRTVELPGFSKYALLNRDAVYMPLKIYQDCTERTVKSIGGILFFDGYKLCQKSIVVHHYIKSVISDDYEYYQNLGKFIQKNKKGINIAEEFIDKYIIIGDLFNSDVHETYVGNLSGPIINANAYISLVKGKHLVNWIIVLLLFIIYFIISKCLWDRVDISTKLGSVKVLRYPIIRFIISLLSYTIVFNILSLALYEVFDYHYNLWLPILWFTVMPSIIKTKDIK